MQIRLLARVAVATLLAASAVGLNVQPAFAEVRSGDILCTSTFQPRLRIDSSYPGSGSWQSKSTGATSGFSFPAGASYRYSPYQNVNWVVNNNPGFFYGVSKTCVQ